MLLTMLHAENGDVIDLLIAEALAAVIPRQNDATPPAWGAVEATLRGAALPPGGCPYIVHMNAGGEVDMLQYASQHGLLVMGETCRKYYSSRAEQLQRSDGAKWICSPPVRTSTDNERCGMD